MSRADQTRFRSLMLLAAAAVLLCSATMITNHELERWLGRPPGSLAWGPALFRVLLALHGLLLLALAKTKRGRRPAPAEYLPVAAVSSRETRWHWIALAALTAVALALRVWRLSSCLWFDEVLTLLDFARHPLGRILTDFSSQNQHMLYSVVAHVSIRVFGESPAALRLPAVLFGVGSIWVLFFLGRRVIGARPALLACALMTVSYHHIWFSQNARGYTGLLFFALLATWLWLEALSRTGWRWWIAYSVAIALGMWTHLTMAFVVAAHALLYVAMRPQGETGFKQVAAFLLSATLSLQLYAFSLPEFFRTAVHEASQQSEWTKPLWAAAESLRSLRIGWSGTAVVLCGAALVVVGFLRILRHDYRAALAMLLPGLLGGSAMIALGHNLWPRFFFFSMGFALLVVVDGTMTLPRLLLAPLRRLVAPGLAGGLGFALAGLLIAASALTVPRCYALPKQDFTGARDYVERQRGPDDAVVTVGLAGKAYLGYFAPHWTIAQSEADLDALRRRYDDIWLIYTLPFEIQAFNPQLWEHIESDFEVVKVFPGTLGGGEIRVCRPRSVQSVSNVALSRSSVKVNSTDRWRR